MRLIEQAAPTPRKFLSMTEAAERYGVHYKLINALVNAGTLPSMKLSRNAVRIPLDALERWEEEQLLKAAK